jgi:alpha-1,6-mannosyltransferase
VQLAAVLAGAGLGGAAVLWVACDRRFERMPVACVLGLALALRLIAAQGSPLLEDDHYRYLWDGLRTATSFDPYRLPPSAFFGNAALAAPWQDILGGINNPDIPTIYGPVLQWLFALAYWIAPGRLGALQALLLTADMAVLLMLARQGTPARWLLAYALHPLVLKEAMASAHPDGLMALALLCALAAWQTRCAAWTGVMLGLAVGTKVAALVAVPLLLLAPPLQQGAALPVAHAVRWALRLGAGLCATLALLYVPFLLNGGSDASALGTFGSQWRFNPLLYRAIEALVPAAAARPLAAALIVAGIVVICWRWRLAPGPAAGSLRTPSPPPVDAALVLLLLLSPVVNPWYWLWVLPLSVFVGRRWVVAGGVMAALSYLNSTVLFDAGAAWVTGGVTAPYQVPWSVTLVQLAVLAGAAAVDLGRRKTATSPHSGLAGHADAGMLAVHTKANSP